MNLISIKSVKSYWLTVILLLLIGCFSRFFLLTNQSLWWDEGLSIYNSDGSSFSDMLFRVRTLPHADRFQPLYYWLLFGIRQLFGDSEIVLRGFSAILGTLTLPVIYLISLRFYGRKYAIWSLALVSFSALLVYYSQEVRNYSLILFLAVLQLYYISEVILKKSQIKFSSKWVFASITGLSLLCSVQMAVVSASLCVSHLLFERSWKTWLKWWLPAGVMGLPVIIYYLTLPGSTTPASIPVSRAEFPIVFNALFVVYGILAGITYGPPQDDLRGDDKLSVIISHLPELIVLLIISLSIAHCLLFINFSKYQEHKFQKSNLFFSYFLLLSFGFSFLLALATGMNWVPRHSIYVWIPVALLFPSIFCWPKRIRLRFSKFRIFSKSLILGLLASNIYSSINYYFNDAYWRDDYRNVAQYLVDYQGSSSTTILLTGELRLLEYYGDIDTTYSQAVVEKIKHGDSTWLADLEQMSNHSEDVVVAIYRQNWFKRKAIKSGFLRGYEILREVDSFKGFKIFHLRANTVIPIGE